MWKRKTYKKKIHSFESCSNLLSLIDLINKHYLRTNFFILLIQKFCMHLRDEIPKIFRFFTRPFKCWSLLNIWLHLVDDKYVNKEEIQQKDSSFHLDFFRKWTLKQIWPWILHNITSKNILQCMVFKHKTCKVKKFFKS